MPVIDASAGSSDAPPNTGTETSSGNGNAPPEMNPHRILLDMATTGWADRITKLKTEAKELREHRQKVAKELKAAQRKNRNLKERARCLSEEDMLQILVMKRSKTTVSEPENASESTASGSGSSAASTPVGLGAESLSPATKPVATAPSADDATDDMRTEM